MTFLAALRHDRIEAACVVDGPINGETDLSADFHPIRRRALG